MVHVKAINGGERKAPLLTFTTIEPPSVKCHAGENGRFSIAANILQSTLDASFALPACLLTMPTGII